MAALVANLGEPNVQMCGSSANWLFSFNAKLVFFLAVFCPSRLSLECDQSFSFSFLKGYIEIISVHYVNILEKEFR